MSASVAEALHASPARARGSAAVEAPAVHLALLGTGTVGSAVLERLSAWQSTGFAEGLTVAHVANSRRSISRPGGVALRQVADALAASPCPSRLDDVAGRLGGSGRRIVIDATASAEVAARHADWLQDGIHVVTACKLARGTGLAAWRAVETACAAGQTEYGDSATVGAGLPLLRSIRALRAGGDRVTAIAGVLSGSLAWLFNHYDGLRPFSGFVRQARDAGFTEPDPREDLSGEDVRRKLLILARAAGFELEQDAVRVTSLVPDAMAALGRPEVDAALPQLDVPLRERFAAAYKNGEKLRFVARLEDGAARVGLESLPADHPLAGGAGTDNKVAIWSDRYDEQPLVIQGPGAGAGVTAAGMLDDVLRIAAG